MTFRLSVNSMLHGFG